MLAVWPTRTHQRFLPEEAPSTFCSRCGLKDILSRDCPCEAPKYSKRSSAHVARGFTHSVPGADVQTQSAIECPDCGCSHPFQPDRP
ncbi:hypothetical protein JTB14_038158 [Gonioctena quinquepunctata]|nr:hypothetical protein JTB14_038158 [Gonioctena quinquepunctata]